MSSRRVIGGPYKLNIVVSWPKILLNGTKGKYKMIISVTKVFLSQKNLSWEVISIISSKFLFYLWKNWILLSRLTPKVASTNPSAFTYPFATCNSSMKKHTARSFLLKFYFRLIVLWKSSMCFLALSLKKFDMHIYALWELSCYGVRKLM